MKINILTNLGAYGYLQEKELSFIQFYYNSDEGIEKGNIYIADNSFFLCIGAIKTNKADIEAIIINNSLSPIVPINELEKLNINELDIAIREAE